MLYERKGKKFDKLPKSYSLEIIKQKVMKNKINCQLLEEVLGVMISFGSKKEEIVVTVEGMFEIDQLSNYIEYKRNDLVKAQHNTLIREMNKMHTEQTVFIIDQSLTNTFYSQFIPVVERDFTKCADLALELEFLKNTLHTYGSRALYFTFDQQYGLIVALCLKKTMDQLSSDTKKITTDVKDMSKKLDQLENLKKLETLNRMEETLTSINTSIGILVNLQVQAQSRELEQKAKE
ncbi:hypothetical protein RFI_26060 [Reticulomyxa filosa]|uniref:Uncharacterized protein n=1 Tax=Reticulomyxa filosa TaxID=46433 RepID=X6MBR7_RETFI|nr:hypothetical protein RFI_26060 [Reticulomyxa filosa]|eukprot:ETO11314.1 hypothetical protein RFI_26060 [Reticulomyxa filosa]